MPNPEPGIQCSNPQCAASNTLKAHCCHRCSSPIVRRYLWSNKAVISQEQKRSLIKDRYLAIDTQIFLDTQPNQPPTTPEEVPPEIISYLQLFPCYPHVPQVYGLLDGTDAWLLDYGTVPSDMSGKLDYPQQLIPEILTLWSEAQALQQLNWLGQIAKLWKPLFAKKVASTLLNSKLIRINAQIVQVMELIGDNDVQPGLKDLGSLWSQWTDDAHPGIQEVLKQIATLLETGKITEISQVISLLDRAASQCQKTRQYSYSVCTLSDSGPNRSNNEDSAYPIYDQSKEIPASNSSLAIVCDGVGGHDGGEIASQETIKHLHSEISSLTLDGAYHSPRVILKQLNKYISESNDIICNRNDSEHRQERQRMGTTLVMALANAHEMYLAHVGDSRIYWITPTSCHQVTIDDDLASREVRLGYAVYRDSLQYPSAGALIQAIGMRDSATLHPNLQRYIIDNDCVFLLCTDGLSDFDRVEQQWRQKLLPVLAGTQDIAGATQDLIDFANEKNGHDNVTVALVHCQVRTSSNSSEEKVAWSDIKHVLKDSSLLTSQGAADSSREESDLPDSTSTGPNIPDQKIGEPKIGEALPTKSQPKWLKPLILVLIAATAIGVLAYGLLKENIKPDNNQSTPFNNPETEIEQKN